MTTFEELYPIEGKLTLSYVDDNGLLFQIRPLVNVITM